MSGKALFDKLWDAHVVADLGGGNALLHVDRHLLHDLSGGEGLRALDAAGRRVRNPELTFAVPDHAVSSAPGRQWDATPNSARCVGSLRHLTAKHGIRLFDLDDPEQGIVHIIGPELGLTQPGVLLVCGDSHTCTHGGLGALAFGIGSSELVHVLATQCMRQRKPQRFRVRFEGTPGPGVAPKDLILHLISRIGANAGTGYAMEYAGSALRAMGVEGRMTVCNLSIELGAKIGMVAPDETTIQYVAGRPFAPRGALFDQAAAHWRTLASDDDASFDREEVIDVGRIAPQITWGNSVEDTIGIDGRVPDPSTAPDTTRAQSIAAALDYMGLTPGQPIAGTRVDWVFIGSCTNSRLSDLRAAAAVAKGRKVAAHVRAWVVPGSRKVKRDAEAEGLDRVFREAGFEWREPGCSMCVAANGEQVGPRQRSVSTSNRNFVGRQGPLARTHLASPAMAAAAAVSGAITDLRRLGG
jgi:3-isopropylmalate/(R)-2-methylmalate dehydratase large subunit